MHNSRFQCNIVSNRVVMHSLA